MHDLVVAHFVEALEVRNVHGSHGLQHRGQRLVRGSRLVCAAQLLACLAQHPQDSGSVETLARTVLTETHCR